MTLSANGGVNYRCYNNFGNFSDWNRIIFTTNVPVTSFMLLKSTIMVAADKQLSL